MEINKYNKSKIYKISSPHTDKIYIGSTTKKYLCSRIAEHTSYFNTWNKDNTKQYCSSFVLYQLGNVEYELIELYNCNNKEELTKRERYWMELHSNFIINVRKSYITDEEHTKDIKKWQEDNKEDIKQYQIEYRQKNRDVLNQKRREYYAKMKALKATQQI